VRASAPLGAIPVARSRVRHFANHLHYSIECLIHIRIANTGDAPAEPAQKGIPSGVIIAFRVGAMGASIDFDDQTRWRAGEIGDVRSDRMLSAEFHSESISPEPRPENGFRIGERSAQLSRARERLGRDISHDIDILRIACAPSVRTSELTIGGVSCVCRVCIKVSSCAVAGPLHRFAVPLPHASQGRSTGEETC
jgi:hypothetical protein